MRTLILTSLLAITASTATAQVLPNRAPFTNDVSLTAPLQGLKLEAAIDGLAKAAGVTAVLKDIPDVTIKTSFSKKPFGEMISTLINVYGDGQVTYEALEGNVLIVAPKASIERVKNTLAPAPAPAPTNTGPVTPPAPVEETVTSVWAVSPLAVRDVQTVITQFMPDVRTAIVGENLLVSGAKSQVDRAQALYNQLRQAQPAPTSGTVTSTFEVNNTEEAKGLISTFIPGVKVQALTSPKVLIIEGTTDQLNRARTLLTPLMPKKAPVSEVGTEDRVQTSYLLVGDSDEIMEALKANFPDVTFQLLPKASMVLVSGTPEQQVRVMSLLQQINVPFSDAALEKAGLAPVAQEVINLRYARAEELAQKLTQVLNVAVQGAAASTPSNATNTVNTINGPVSATPSTPSAPAPVTVNVNTGPTTAASAPVAKPTTTQEVKIVADGRSNSLIVTGTTAQRTRVREAVKALDVVVAQVRLRVRVEQVAITDANTLGVNWKVGVGGFNVGASGSGITAGFNPASAATSLPALEVKLDALQRAGRSKTIMNNTFMAADNEQTKFTSGGELNIKLRTSSSSGEGGGSSTTSSTESFQKFPYGLNVDFTPRIGADGNIDLKINTSVSQRPVGDMTTYFTTDKSELSGRINIQSGAEVVLGGLVTAIDKDDRKGVPGLSQIPLIGGLFRQTDNTNEQTTLLFIVSGEIVDSNGKVITFAPVVSAPRSGAAAPSSSAQRSGVVVGQPNTP